MTLVHNNLEIDKKKLRMKNIFKLYQMGLHHSYEIYIYVYIYMSYFCTTILNLLKMFYLKPCCSFKRLRCNGNEILDVSFPKRTKF